MNTADVLHWASEQDAETRWELLIGIASGYHHGNIRDLALYLEGLSDLSIFNGDVFPRGIRPSDVDGEVEINGRLLRLDWKRPGCAGPSGGEFYTAKNLAKERGDVTVFVFGRGSEVEALDVFMPYREPGWSEGVRTSRVTGQFEANREDLRTLARVWAAAADRREDFIWIPSDRAA